MAAILSRPHLLKFHLRHTYCLGLVCHISIMCVFICYVVYHCIMCLSHLYCLYYSILNVYFVTRGKNDFIYTKHQAYDHIRHGHGINKLTTCVILPTWSIFTQTFNLWACNYTLLPQERGNNVIQFSGSDVTAWFNWNVKDKYITREILLWNKTWCSLCGGFVFFSYVQWFGIFPISFTFIPQNYIFDGCK